MAIAFTSYGPFDNVSSGAAAAIESSDISYVAGQPVIVEAGASATLTIADTPHLVWTQLALLYYATSGEYQYVWYAIPSSSGTTKVTVTRASSGSYFAFSAKAYTSDSGTPVLIATNSLGSYTSAATPFSRVVNPTTSGSAVWLVLHTSGGAGNPTPGSGCAIYSSFVSAGNRTSVRIGTSTEPLTSNASVTLAGTTTADFQYAQWIVYEVPYFVPGPPVLTTQPNTRAVNVGGDASFSAVAASQGGTGLTYAWEYNDGGGWTSAGGGSTYTISGASSGVNGRQVRVTATDSLGSVTSDIATLTVITSWPELTGAFGELAFGEADQTSSGTSTDLAASGQAQATGGATLLKGIDLSGAGTAQASGTAPLLKGVNLAGAGLSVASGTAGAQLSVPLGASASAQASGAGQLLLNIGLTAAGLAQALGAASLALSKLLAASDAAQASGAAGLSLAKVLAAAGAAQAAGAANASVSGGGAVNLAAAGQAQATGSINLSLVITLQATALAQAFGQAGLALTKRLGASGQAQSGGSVSLWLDIRLGAQAAALASGSAPLNLQIALNANDVARASGSAQLRLDVALQVDGHAQAFGTASLAVFSALEGVSVIQVPPRQRNWTFSPESRLWQHAPRRRNWVA